MPNALPNQSTKEQLALAQEHLAKGRALLDDCRFGEALPRLHDALAVCRGLGSHGRPGLATIYAHLGKCHLCVNEPDKALHYHRLALEVRSELFGEEGWETLESRHDLGEAWLHKSNFGQAMPCFEKILKAIGREPGGQLPDFVPALYRNVGGVYRDFDNDLRQALPYFQNALKTGLQIFGEHHHDIAQSHNVLGSCYDSMGKFTQSIEHYEKGISIQHRAGNAHPHVTVMLYTNMGGAHLHQQQSDLALGCLQKALAMEHNFEAELKKARLFICSLMGRCHQLKQDYAQAENYMLQALEIGLECHRFPHPELVMCCHNLGSLYINTRQTEKALAYIQKGLQAAVGGYANDDIYDNPPLEKYVNGRLFVRVLRNKAAAFFFRYRDETKDPKDIEAALSASRLAIRLIEQIRHSHRADTSKLVWTQTMGQAYIFGMVTAYTAWKNISDAKQHFLEKCFWFAEKAKAHLLLSVMQDSIAKAAARLPSGLLEKERAFRMELAQLEKDIQQAESQAVFSEGEKAAKAKKVTDLEVEFLTCNQRYRRFVKQLEQDQPDYYQLKHQTQTASIAQTQAVLKEGELLVQYSIGETSMFIFAVSREGVWLHETKKPDEFGETVVAFLRNMFLGNIREHVRLSALLYGWLIAPVGEALDDKTKLIFIPDGDLHRLPFDALVEPLPMPDFAYNRLPYLVRRFAIQHHYSATTLHYARQKEQGRQSWAAKDGFLGIAPVTFGKPAPNSGGYMLKSSADGRETIFKSGGGEHAAPVDLADTETEVKAVYELFGQRKKEAAALFYDMASKENLLEHIGRYGYILLSTHGFADREHDMLSGLELHAENRADAQSGRLYISDVMNLNLNADLVVLSSCESGVGKLQTGEGMMALHRAFLHAGASNIIYSVFKVPQDATSELMQAFFRHVLEGDGYAVALQKAKLALLENEAMGPVDWAGFALVGV